MSYRRALLFVDPNKDFASAVSVLQRVAPELERLLVVVPGSAEVEPTERATRDAAPRVEVQRAQDLGHAAIRALCIAEDIDLVVFASRSFRSASLVAAQRLPVAVLWADGASREGPLTEVGCVALNERSRVALGAFLRDHGDPSMHVSLLSPTPLAANVFDAAVDVSAFKRAITVSSPDESHSLRQWIDQWSQALDLVVVAQIPTALLLGALVAPPVLFVPTVTIARPFSQRAIDVADLVDDGGPLRVRIDQVAALGSFAPVSDQAFAFVTGGRVIATLTTREGEVELPAGLELESLGVARVDGTEDPLASIEQRVAVIRPDAPLVLIDAEIPDDRLRTLAATHELLTVRLRPTRSCHSIRKRLRAFGATARVIDARTVLDEGVAQDVSEALDPVRLERVAEALRCAGFAIAQVIQDASTREPAPLFAPTDGNRIELELDNAKARRWLLEAIDHSQRTLHLQVYMALDDDVGSAVDKALAAAGARGVKVRVLVDSLHGLHGSFGTHNALLSRLSRRAGVELRMVRPITEMPSLRDLKQRDHRKLVIADGTLALLGGRNLSREYYTAFEEARITAMSSWRDVPWLDSGARVEGPAVGAIQQSFLNAWIAAGGEAFPVETPAPVGTSRARVVVHRGLHDARTLEAYRELVDTARSHVYVVNGFPLVLELQHALVRALRRGVRVRALIGHPAPTHDGQTFSGAWSSARTFATDLVHSRMDPIIEAGGQAFLFARSDVPGWEAGLGIVHPHVHAKAISVDGERCALGSANLDITASYWESELLLVVEDWTLARGFEAQIEALIAGSPQVQRDDPRWQQIAQRRAWMRHWPGVLSV